VETATAFDDPNGKVASTTKPIRGAALPRALLLAAAVCLLAAFTGTAGAQARMSAPSLQDPAANATVQSLPAFTWASVKGAAQYDFEFAADTHFSSGVSGFGSGDVTVTGTDITNDKAIANGTYYWRVRGVSAADHPGPWSKTRIIRKNWSGTPQLVSPSAGTTVSWPSEPPVLKWNPVPGAVSYDVWLASDSGLSNLVLGSVSSPQTTYATQLALTSTLTPGTYYWAITPVDAEGNKGVRSRITSFQWNWPSSTTTTESNVATDAGIVDPQFSWDPVPGAVGYQVEVNSSQDFPTGSKWCCDGTVPGTTLSPQNLLPNGTFYWRVRAVDSIGDAGAWNVGQPFQESFDQQIPTVPNLQLRDVHNNMAALDPGASTDTPIVTWDPVPGASSYELQLTPYEPGFGCDWTNGVSSEVTTNTAWTPVSSGSHIGPGAWPGPEGGIQLNPNTYCFRLAARRDDGSQGGGQVVTDWTQLGDFNGAAFTYSGPPTSSGELDQTTSQYLSPTGGATLTSTPLFTWQTVPGANGYYVIVARDQNFTDVVDIGYTKSTAYAPSVPYADETTSYWWAVVPAQNADGTGVNSDPEDGQDNPQTFNKSSIAPTPLSPANGDNAGVEPTFRWTSAEGARNYHLQVAEDPSFSNPLLDVVTDSAAYTTASTLPADTTLYWRVQADDANNHGYNWSAINTFTHNLPVPTPSSDNPTSGHTIPLLAWRPVPGAIGYDLHTDQPDGTTKDFTTNAPDFTPTQFYGTGAWRWQVRADFPGSGASSAYFTPEATFTRVIPPPSGMHATKSGIRILLSWNPDQDAKQYQVELSTTDGFGSPVASDQTDNPVWAPQIDATTAAHKLYWRVAAIDTGGDVGAYDAGVFKAPPKHKKHRKHKKKSTKRGKGKRH
jgi:hypothetical protein